jgi:murein DD-endopeptidase MepM/ murein hydrolase activator NlpD
VSKFSRKDFFRIAVPVLLVGGIVALCLHLCTSSGDSDITNVYAADVPLAQLPQEIKPCMLPLSAEQIARIPLADGFQWPVGGGNLVFMYDAQGFGVHNEKRGGYHSGVDLNGIGGENTDLGEAVSAAARGTVVYCGTPSDGWGKVVVIAHRIPGDDRVYQTLYAHLQDVAVTHGDRVSRGQKIGTIGTAEGAYLAHLHFEVIDSCVVEAGVTAYHPSGTMNRINPYEFINAHPAPPFPDPLFQVDGSFRLRESLMPMTR